MALHTKYYDDLGVKPNATVREINEAYRQFMREAENNFYGTEQRQYISMIYLILSDVDQRGIYDEFGEATEADDNDSGKLYFIEYKEKHESLDTLNGFHRLEHNLKVSLRDMLNVAVKRLRIKRYIKCMYCCGDNVCEGCNGQRTYQMEPFVVVFDASEKSTKTYTLLDKSNSRNYIPTLLTVHLMEEEHPVFKRKGVDMIMEMSFDYRQALLGFDRVFTSVDDRMIYIRKRLGYTTHNGEKMFVRHEGCTYFHEENDKKMKRKGHLYINCHVNWDKLFTLSEPVVSLLKRTSPSDGDMRVYSKNVDLRLLRDRINFDVIRHNNPDNFFEFHQLNVLSLSEPTSPPDQHMHVDAKSYQLESLQGDLNFDLGQQNELDMTEHLQ